MTAMNDLTRWFGRAAGLTVVVFVFYLLSTGPAWWLQKHGVISKTAFEVIYQPTEYFIENSPGDIFYSYVAWWSPVIEW